jgi:colanic acid/amylovoran biosynthesis glycosyltransferase
MKIGYFVGRFPQISETFVVGQITAMIERGHDVEIDSTGRPGPAERRDVGALQKHVRYMPPPPTGRLARTVAAARVAAKWGLRSPGGVLESLNAFRYGRDALNFSILRERLPLAWRRQNYDVIHCHFAPNALRALALRDIGIIKGPLLTTFHGYDANWLPRLYGKGMYRRLFRRGDCYTVGSEFMRSRILSLGAPADRIVKLPMGVDLKRFTFVPRSLEPGARLRLLTVARLNEVKGIEFALRAVGLVKQQGIDCAYRVIGEGPLRRHLEEVAQRLGIEGEVQFLGAIPHEQVLSYYEDAHVFLLPGIATDAGEEEGQGIVLAEAQAAGLPVVATRVGGMPECVPDAAAEFLVPQRDAAAIAAAIAVLVSRRSQWGALGRAGRAYVEAHYDIGKLNDRLERLYESLAAGRAPAAVLQPAA